MEPERDGERYGPRPHSVSGMSKPAGFQFIRIDSRIFQSLLKRLDDQGRAISIPAFPEPRATHADDCNLVPDAICHVLLLQIVGRHGHGFPEIMPKAPAV